MGNQRRNLNRQKYSDIVYSKALLFLLGFFAGLAFREPSAERGTFEILRRRTDEISSTVKNVGLKDDGILRRPLGLKALKRRDQLGAMLEEMGLETGLEVGVQRGLNSRGILTSWPSCKVYHLVDPWVQQGNYSDFANVDDSAQSQIYLEAVANLEAWSDKTTFHRMLSTEAAAKFDDGTLDFVYIDARHDYCAVVEDLAAYWPLIRPGGVLAGHDYLTNPEQQAEALQQDWGLCADGTRNEGAVRGAVEDFAMRHGLVISVCYEEKVIWKTWMVQKPWYEVEVDPSAELLGTLG